MRAFVIRSSMVIGFLVLVVLAGGIVLAVLGPFHPGDIMFPIQDYAEQRFIIVSRDPVKNADYLLNLAERRINDLNMRVGSTFERIAMYYLGKSIDQASRAISVLPPEKGDPLRTRLVSLAKRTDDVLRLLKHVPVEDPLDFAAFQAKVATLQHMVGTIDTSDKELALVRAMTMGVPKREGNKANPVNSASGLIPWPLGSAGAVHAFYPLVGQHVIVACASCHNDGRYLGTPTECIQCHFLKRPIPHYVGECGLCHTPLAWADIHFDHATVTAVLCSACHQEDAPPNHYYGPCSACHNTENWTTETFDHAVTGAVDCISCHGKDAPANHYAGQCSRCHNTSNWTSVVFDHTGFTDCISCHAKDAPGNHYAGQCSNCHSTSGPWKDAHFNHSGFADCIGCHAGNAPGNHYAGQCSNCHNTSSWKGAVFNHAGFSDCISCHLNDRPAEHDQGQCSECHNTQGWGDAGEGGGGDMALTNGIILQTVTCSTCHETRIVSVRQKLQQ